MPGVYKLKNCKFCSKEHRKKGPYCGQSCASKDKEPTEAMREAMRQVATEYNQTPEAAAKRRQFGTSLATMNGDDCVWLYCNGSQGSAQSEDAERPHRAANMDRCHVAGWRAWHLWRLFVGAIQQVR